jgi:Pyruvate/2-oxoacid:ferredoxin oxidoreductase delta subunit
MVLLERDFVNAQHSHGRALAFRRPKFYPPLKDARYGLIAQPFLSADLLDGTHPHPLEDVPLVTTRVAAIEIHRLQTLGEGLGTTCAVEAPNLEFRIASQAEEWPVTRKAQVVLVDILGNLQAYGANGHVDEIEAIARFEPPPQRKLMTRLLEHRLLAGLRDLTRPIHGSETARRLLYRLGIMQDVYEVAEARIERLVLDRGACDECGKCLAVCPIELPITDSDFDFWASPNCLGCLYCAFVCPQEAITIEGELGYLKARLARYGEAMRSL